MKVERVQFIESEAYDREIISRVFCGKFEIEFSHSVKAALLSFHEFQPQAIVFDMGYPNPEALDELMNFAFCSFSEIPVILIVSENTLEFERYARAKRVFYFMIKPFEFKELEEAINSAIRLSVKQNAKAL